MLHHNILFRQTMQKITEGRCSQNAVSRSIKKFWGFNNSMDNAKYDLLITQDQHFAYSQYQLFIYNNNFTCFHLLLWWGLRKLIRISCLSVRYIWSNAKGQNRLLGSVHSDRITLLACHTLITLLFLKLLMQINVIHAYASKLTPNLDHNLVAESRVHSPRCKVSFAGIWSFMRLMDRGDF